MQSSLPLTHGARTCYTRTCYTRTTNNTKFFTPRDTQSSRKLTKSLHFSNNSHSISTVKLTKPQENSHFAKPISPISGRWKSSLLCANSSSDNAITASGGSGSVGDASNTGTNKNWIEAAGEAISTAFPLWVALGCLLGVKWPSAYDWVQPSWTIMGITLTMLGIGMTLTFDDLKGALAMPKELFTGFVLQYSNSVLGVVLATKHIGNPSTAVPCAVSSVCHSIFGSALAGVWRRAIPAQVQEDSS